MCDPATLLTLSIVSTGVSIGTSALNQQRQGRFEEQQFEATKKNADAAALTSYAQLQERQREEAAKAAQSIDQSARQAVAARGAARVNAGESGAVGNSADALQNEFVASELGYQHAIIRNQAFLDSQFKSEMESVQLQQTGRIQQAQPQPVPMPDYAGMLINGASNYLSIKKSLGSTAPQH